MKILIIRHGDPDYSIDSLTEKGWREAELLSRRLAPLSIRDFYVSPLGRAQDTARPTLEKTGKQAETLPWLMEFRGQVWDPFGRMEQKKHIPWNLMPQYWTKCPDLFDKNAWLTHPLFASTGEVREVYEEIGAGVEELLLRYGYAREGMLFRCERNSRDTIALFCHFGAGLAILSHLLGVALPVLWGGFFLPTSSVTTLVTEERVQGEVFFKCMQVGDTSHLYAGGEPVSSSGLFPEIYGE